eukprot:10176129-Alexandrium_andersonii.AAC.1
MLGRTRDALGRTGTHSDVLGLAHIGTYCNVLGGTWTYKSVVGRTGTYQDVSGRARTETYWDVLR